MENKILAHSTRMKNGLDDDYTLFENGEILHEYDQNIYPGGQNKTRKLVVQDLSPEVRLRLIDAALEENKQIVRQILDQK